MFSLFRSATIYFLYKKFKTQIIFVCAYLILLYLINSIIDDFIDIYTYSNSHQISLLVTKWSINILSFIFIIYKIKNMNLKKDSDSEEFDFEENKDENQRIFRDRTQIILDRYVDDSNKKD